MPYGSELSRDIGKDYRSTRCKSLVNRVQRKFQTVRNAELVEDVVQMVLNRLLADEHLLRHFAILVALRHQAHDLALALAERRPFPALAPARRI